MKGDTPLDSLVKLGELENDQDTQQAQQTAAAAHASTGGAAVHAGRGFAHPPKLTSSPAWHIQNFHNVFASMYLLHKPQLIMQPVPSATCLSFHIHECCAAPHPPCTPVSSIAAIMLTLLLFVFHLFCTCRHGTCI
jgi:hypothetical protein